MNQLPKSSSMNANINPKKRLSDPVLEELWAIKAQINAEGGYDLKTISERAKAFAARYIDASGRIALP